MRSLDIQAGKSTPRVLYSRDENVLSLTGSSLPENVYAFFKPIMEWVDEFAASPVLNPALRLIFKIQYYNSGTMRSLAEMLTAISNLRRNGLQFSVEWYYENDDDIIKEAGEDLSEITEIKFIMVPYK
jgi:hypothetical protein